MEPTHFTGFSDRNSTCNRLPRTFGHASLVSVSLPFWFRSLSRSFIAHLTREYGERWRIRVRRYADSLSEAQGSALVCSIGKRKRLPQDQSGHHKVGGLEPVGPQKTHQTKTKHSTDAELLRDVECGFRILRQVSISSWWDWTGGSSLFFWRWNGKEQIRGSRDGINIFVTQAFPSRGKQKTLRLPPEQRPMVAAKLETMIYRNYLEPGHVSNTVHFFAVPKGDADIRMVYDGTSSGLNDTMFAPNFWLPSARSAANVMGFGTWMADMDFGEMFHNFPMHPRVRPFAGVEVGSLASSIRSLEKPEGKQRPTKLRWTRLFMGMRSSPYLAIRHYYWGEEFARGSISKGQPHGV